MGGRAIGEVIRRTWSRLVRKQWLVLYPLALAVVNTLAFLAVYAVDGDALRSSAFFTENYDRWQYLRDAFFAPFSFTPGLAIAVFAGLAVCLFTAMIRAPYFRAIAGAHYPLAPRKWEEVGNLFVFYLFVYLVGWVLPFATPTEGFFAQLVYVFGLVISVLVVFADYIIVYEANGFVPALRRSVQLLSRRWGTVLLIVVVFSLVDMGIHALYGLYYGGAAEVFILLPVSQVLVESIIVLVFDLVLIFLYEDIRRGSHV